MLEVILAAVTDNAAEAAITAARHGAKVAGQFSPINTALGASCLTMLGLILKFLYDNRKLTIERDTGLRGEFISEMANLRKENGELRDEIQRLHKEVFELHGLINAMRQSNISAAQMVARNLSDDAQGIERAIGQLNDID